MPMDELHQTDDFPDNNMSKNAFWLLQTYIEAITRPHDANQRNLVCYRFYFYRSLQSGLYPTGVYD
jgi:hypothetical protein